MLRDAVPPADRQHCSIAITTRLLALPWIPNAHRIALYASLGSEVDTGHAFAALRSRGVTCCFPAVLPENRLQFVDVTDLRQLRPGTYGIREPAGAAVTLETVDLMILPGLAFDAQGVRLGYGGGYYDRALTHFNGICVGLAYAVQVHAALPVAAHDRAMDVVVTEQSIIPTSARARHALGSTQEAP